MYRDHLMDHYKNPRGFGKMQTADAERTEKNPSCGDTLTFQFIIEDDKVKDVRFSGEGCAISMASASMLAEEIIGMDVDDIIRMDREEMLDMIGAPLSTMRVKCGLLGLHTAKKALAMYASKKGGEW